MALDFPFKVTTSRTMPAAVCVVALVAFLILYALQFISTQTSREPPEAPSSIPYLGHVFGLMRGKFDYYVQLKKQFPFPMFTLTMPGLKTYVATTPELVQSIQKQPKNLSFPAAAAKFTQRICDVSDATHEKLMQSIISDGVSGNLYLDAHEAMRAALRPGADLDKMNRQMMLEVADSLDTLATDIQDNFKIFKLSEWLRNIVTLATTNSVYGPQNPFKDKDISDAFWDFESDLMGLLVGFMPSIMARKGLAGRAKLCDAFEKYFRADGHQTGSALTQNRFNAPARNGVPIDDIAKWEVGGAIAILVNTAPAVFWMLILVYAHPGLLEDIRKEVEATMAQATDDNAETSRTIEITNVKSACPLLASTLQEILRCRSIGTSVREVMGDMTLNDQFFLKKGHLVLMPSRVIHWDPSVWGSDVEDFNPERFLRDKKARDAENKNPPAHAFRAFGGGSTLCPGRHFATTEILAVVTMFVVRFDMSPIGGKWSLPTTKNSNAASVIMEPDWDIEVKVSKRLGFEDDNWVFGLQTSEKVFAIVAEDRQELENR